MSRYLSTAALVISIAALVLAIGAHRSAEDVAREMIDRREQRLIDALWPGLRMVGRDLGVPADRWRSRPDTLEELLAPLFEAVDAGGG